MWTSDIKTISWNTRDRGSLFEVEISEVEIYDQDILSWVEEEFTPGEVFRHGVLTMWAEQNGFVPKED